MAISKASKILFVVGSLLSLAGIICIIVGTVAGDQAGKIDWKATDQSSFTLTVSGDHCGFSLYMKRGGDCDSVYSNTVINGPEGKSSAGFLGGGDINFYKDCKIDDTSEMEKEENLMVLGHFYIPEKSGTKNSLTGDYKVRSSGNLWAMDVCAEFVEAVGGIMAMLGLLALAIALIVIGLILCCVGCCCLQSGKGGQ